MLAKIKSRLHWAGGALAAASVVFVVMRLHHYSVHIEMSRLESDVWKWLVVFSVIYGAANIMLSLGWSDLLDYLGSRVSKLWAIKVYGVTQLAKYVPSNIMHFASRQAVGLSAGLPGKTLAKSMAWELGLLALSGGTSGILAFSLLSEKLSLLTSLLLFLCTACCTGVLLCYNFSCRVTRAFAWFVSFLVLSGLIFAGLLDIVQASELSPTVLWLPLCGSYVLAWLIGLLTPGAPAGIGIREMVLLFLLKGVVHESDLYLAVLLGRVITIAGDTFFFAAISFIISQKLNDAALSIDDN